MEETKENKYSRGKIYKLVPKTYEGVYITYYGSTCEKYLSSRLSKHKYDYKNKIVSSFKLFEDYGIDNIDIILVENYPCNNRYELEARERFYIEGNICLNKAIPTRTYKEYYQDNKEEISEKGKKYRELNKEIISEKKKIIRQENIEQYREMDRLRHQKRKDDDNYKEMKKLNYEKNKEKILEKMKMKIKCECGSEIRISDLLRHEKTTKHLNFINNQNNN
jgi:hypothetical protein